MNKPEDKQAEQILSLVMNGSSIEDAMESVIGPGDWSDQSAQLEQAIEEALKSTYARVEDWHWEKAKFDGSNCGIGSGGFQPGNTCAAGDGAGGQKPKAKRGRKRAAPSTEGKPGDAAAKPAKKPRAKAAPKGPKQPAAPKAPRKPKSPPKPQHIARAKKAIASLSKSLRKMGQKTLKNLLSRVKAAKKALKKAPGTLKKKAKGLGSSIGKGIRTIKGRREQKRKRRELRSQAQQMHPAFRKLAQDSIPVLSDLYSVVRGDAKLEPVVRLAHQVQTAIAYSPDISDTSSLDTASDSLGGVGAVEMLKALTPANVKRLVDEISREKGPQAGKKIGKTLQEIQRSAKKTQSLIRNLAKVESMKFARSRIEDKFYFSR